MNRSKPNVLVLVVLLVLENVQTGWVVEDEEDDENEDVRLAPVQGE